MIKSLKYIILLLYCFVWKTVQGQRVDSLKVKVLGEEIGISQLNALSISFDYKGYLWIGTENGLNQFNASRLKIFKSGKGKDQLIDDHIRGMHAQNDTLWLATNTHAIAAYLLKEKRFVNFDKQLNLKKNPLLPYSTSLLNINRRYMVLGIYGNCLLVDKKENSFYKIPLPNSLKNDYVASMALVDAKRILVATNANGMYLLDWTTKKIYPTEGVLQYFKHSKIYKIYNEDNSNFLIASDTGLFRVQLRYNTIKKIYQPKNSLYNITGIYYWDKDHIFLTTINDGFLLNKKGIMQKLVYTDLNGKVIEVEVTEVLKDPSGAWWLATKGRGLLYYHPHLRKFKTNKIVAPNAPRKDFISIFNFLREKNKLWMATEFGFAQYDYLSQRYKYYPEKALEYTIVKDAYSNIWGGGFEQGLVKYNSNNDDFEVQSTDIKDKDIIQITPVSKDSLWIHTWSSGIYAMNIHDLKIKKKNFLGNTMVRSRISLIDSSGRIWLGTDEGVFKIDKDEVKYYHDFNNNRVFALAEDLEKNIWIGTAQGLNKLNVKTEKITYFGLQEGMPNDFIYGIQVDRKGNIWCSTNYGLSRYNPYKKIFRHFTRDDGLQSNEFNGKASYKDEEGNLYFGGMNGYNVFHPEKIYVNRYVGNTYIEGVSIYGKLFKDLSYGNKEVKLKYEDKVISFDFASLNFFWSEKNKYKFKLEGFDKDWRLVTSEHSTTYTNLDPGTYYFRVKGSNNEGLWGKEDVVKLIITPPWYLTWWFKGGVVIGALIMILGLYKYKMYKQEVINLNLMKRVRERTNELVDALKVSEKQKKEISFLMKELSHRVKNNLQIITSLIDIQDLSIQDAKAKEKLKLLQMRVFTVSRIHDLLSNSENHHHIRVDEFVRQLCYEIVSFSKEKINLHLDLDYFNSKIEKLTYLGLILNELITNSIKHAFVQHEGIKEISITLKESPHQIELIYKDNGRGFTQEALNKKKQEGVFLINLLVQELNGSVDLNSENGAQYKIIFIRNTPENYEA